MGFSRVRSKKFLKNELQTGSECQKLKEEFTSELQKSLSLPLIQENRASSLIRNFESSQKFKESKIPASKTKKSQR